MPRLLLRSGDVVAIDIKFGGEVGRRLWAEIARRSQEFDALIHRQLDIEFGPGWETMATVYHGSTHVNVVLYSNDGDDGGNDPQFNQPQPARRSVFDRVVGAISRAVDLFVGFAKELWPHVEAFGTVIVRAAADALKAKHALDDLASLLGFRDAKHAARTAVAWLLGLWGFGPLPA